MTFRTVHLPIVEDFLACSIATTVLVPDVRVLAEIGDRVVRHGYEWCQANRDPAKAESWWRTVQRIEGEFDWAKFLEGDPITAKVYGQSFQFGSIGRFGGGCHRTIALAVRVLRDGSFYRPFNIQLACF